MSAIPVPFDPREVFGKARAPVEVALNDYVYRSTIAIYGGEAFVPLRRSHREAAGVDPGATLEVILTLDTAPREVAVPKDLAVALASAGAREAWDKLSFTAKREDAEGVEGAKRPETRAKRIAAAVERLNVRLPSELDFLHRTMHISPHLGVMQRDRTAETSLSRLRLGRFHGLPFSRGVSFPPPLVRLRASRARHH